MSEQRKAITYRTGDDWPDLLTMLADVYEPEGVGVWLFSRQKRFAGMTAIEMSDAGRMGEVLAAAEQLATGAFS